MCVCVRETQGESGGERVLRSESEREREHK